jgi:hypothetical protein
MNYLNLNFGRYSPYQKMFQIKFTERCYICFTPFTNILNDGLFFKKNELYIKFSDPITNETEPVTFSLSSKYQI